MLTIRVSLMHPKAVSYWHNKYEFPTSVQSDAHEHDEFQINQSLSSFYSAVSINDFIELSKLDNVLLVVRRLAFDIWCKWFGNLLFSLPYVKKDSGYKNILRYSACYCLLSTWLHASSIDIHVERTL